MRSIYALVQASIQTSPPTQAVLDTLRSAARAPEALAGPASIASNKEVVHVAALSVRDLDETVRERLRVRAAQHGRSMEAEIRAILTAAVSPPTDPRGLAQTLLARFGDLGGVDLELPRRVEAPRAANLSR